jgi:hypothetical protein
VKLKLATATVRNRMKEKGLRANVRMVRVSQYYNAIQVYVKTHGEYFSDAEQAAIADILVECGFYSMTGNMLPRPRVFECQLLPALR